MAGRDLNPREAIENLLQDERLTSTQSFKVSGIGAGTSRERSPRFLGQRPPRDETFLPMSADVSSQLFNRCKSCHSADVTGEAMQAEVDRGLADIVASAGRVLVETYLRPLVNTGFIVTAYDQVSDRYSVPVTITTLPPDSRSVSFALEIHCQESACMTLPAAIQVTWTGDTSPTNSTLIKALWNYYLIKGDGSRGIHNPTFVYQILTNTQAALSP